MNFSRSTGVFIGNSKMASLMRSHDWSKTPLGSPESWSHSLKTAVRIMVTSRQPMVIWWGEALISLYNDAYCSVLGTRHPGALGRSASIVWSDIWEHLSVQVEQVLRQQEAIDDYTVPLVIQREDYVEKICCTLSYSPIPNDDGGLGGVLCTAVESTVRVESDRPSVVASVNHPFPTSWTTFQDINDCKHIEDERNQAEAELHRRETQLRLITDSLPVLISYVDAERRYRFANQTYKNWFGILPQDIIGKHVEEILGHDAYLAIRPDIDRVLSGEPISSEKYVFFKTAGWRHVQRDFIPDIAEDGEVKGYYALVMDVTQRKEAEASLRRSEERFRISQELSLDGFTILDSVQDETGKIVDFEWAYVNPKAAEILQRSSDELMGQRLLDVLSDNQLNAELFQRYVRVVETGEPHDIELPYETDGLSGWVRNMAVKLNDGVAIFFSDITERKQFEQALRESEAIARITAEELAALMEITPAAIWIAHDPDCHYITANLAAHQLMRIEPGAAATATPADGSYPFPFKICRNGQEVAPQDLPMQLASREDREITSELEFVFEDGTRFIYGTAVPLYNADGNIRGSMSAFVDITNRKQIEEALRTSEERLRFAVEGAALGTWEYDLASSRILWSDRCKRMFGVALDAAVDYDRFIRCIHPDDRDRIHAAVEEAIAQREMYDVEMRSLWADGSIHWIRSIGRARYDHNGVPTRMIGVALDITDRKQAEAALRESEERYRTLFESIDEGFCIIEVLFEDEKPVDYRFLITNPAFEKQTGFKDVVGRTVRDITLYHEDYWFERYGRVALTGESIRVEDFSEGFNGWYEVHAFRVGEPALRRVGILFNNITERRKAEEELRQKNAILNVINESTPTPIFVKDRDGRIIYANPATLEVLGRSADEVIGYRDCDIYPNPDDAAKVMENDRRIMETGQMEVVEESPDGIRTFLGMKVPYRNEFGEVIGLIGISNDISDRVQIERSREQVLQQEQAARQAAEAANRIKDEFLAVVSHELRSPLNPILGWSKLLRTRQLDEQKTERALEVIERNAQMQAQLINDLLDVSKILRGKLSLDSRPVDLTATVQSAMETVRLAAEAKAIQIHTHFESDVGQVSGDAGRLQQVIWNLLSNAVKFTPDGGQVDIYLERKDSQAHVTVRDTGKGIPADFLPHVFEHFRQESSATTRRFGGLGLGLAIARYLVELHGGTIHVDSAGEGEGATFTVSLPLMPHQLVTSCDERPLELSLELQGLKILVVDDDDSTREFLAYFLELYGATIRVVATAAEAIALLPQFQPDLLLSDIGMPDVDGYMLMQQIRALSPEQGGMIPAIALTAYAGEIDYQQAIAVGFQQHIAKPLEPQVLIQAIAELRRRSSG